MDLNQSSKKQEPKLVDIIRVQALSFGIIESLLDESLLLRVETTITSQDQTYHHMEYR